MMDTRVTQVAAPGWVEYVLDRLRNLPPRLLVGGEWVEPAEGATAKTYDPSTGQPLATVAVASAQDIDRAVRAAQEAQPAWAALTMAERGEYLLRLRQRIADEAALLATADAINAGLPVERMFKDIDNVLASLAAWPGLALSLRGEVLTEGTPGLHYTRLAPYGVVARIVAFNHPVMFAAKGALAALMAGNVVILKAADQTPLSALLLGELVREVFPPGVWSIVTGDASTGQALVSHSEIRRIGFTGSVRTGMAIQKTAAETRVCTVSLELGGKNAMLVFPDADAERVARSVLAGMSLRANAGQSCGSTSRIFVHAGIYEDVVNRVSTHFAGLALGAAYDPTADMGPLISQAAADRAWQHIDAAVAGGATVVTGGRGDPRIPEQGYFVPPTLLAGAAQNASARVEEIFGPVVVIEPWDDLDAVLGQINAVDYGLTASIWTNDLTQAHRAADRIDVGYVWINDSARHYFGMPFGGWKDSGTGREESVDELRGYLQVKSINVNLS